MSSHVFLDIWDQGHSSISNLCFGQLKSAHLLHETENEQLVEILEGWQILWNEWQGVFQMSNKHISKEKLWLYDLMRCLDPNQNQVKKGH